MREETNSKTTKQRNDRGPKTTYERDDPDPKIQQMDDPLLETTQQKSTILHVLIKLLDDYKIKNIIQYILPFQFSLLFCYLSKFKIIYIESCT